MCTRILDISPFALKTGLPASQLAQPFPQSCGKLNTFKLLYLINKVSFLYLHLIFTPGGGGLPYEIDGDVRRLA